MLQLPELCTKALNPVKHHRRGFTPKKRESKPLRCVFQRITWRREVSELHPVWSSVKQAFFMSQQNLQTLPRSDKKSLKSLEKQRWTKRGPLTFAEVPRAKSRRFEGFASTVVGPGLRSMIPNVWTLPAGWRFRVRSQKWGWKIERFRVPMSQKVERPGFCGASRIVKQRVFWWHERGALRWCCEQNEAELNLTLRYLEIQTS